MKIARNCGRHVTFALVALSSSFVLSCVASISSPENSEQTPTGLEENSDGQTGSGGNGSDWDAMNVAPDEEAHDLPDNLGQFCVGNDQCRSKSCVDGVCCSTSSCSACQRCNSDEARGRCSPVETDARCPTNGSSCGQRCREGSCSYAAATTVCTGKALCMHDKMSGGGQCDGQGQCAPLAPTPCPGNLKCNTTAACKTECTSDQDCRPQHVCTQGTCAPDPVCRSEKFFGTVWQNWTNAAEAKKGLDPIFNQLTPENAGKWHEAERQQGVYNWARLDAMFAYCAQEEILCKQHFFVGWNGPSWVTNQNAAGAVENWIKTFMARYPTTPIIDVVNEAPLDAPRWRDAIGGAGESGWDWVLWSFEKARANAPNAILILNDYDILKSDGGISRMLQIVRPLKRRGHSIAIGCQAHLLEGESAASVKRRLDILAREGLPIFITEFDINIANDSLQRDRLAELFKVLWEHPSVRGITHWGFRQGQMWSFIRDAYLVSSDGRDRASMSWLRTYLAEKPSAMSVPSPSNGSTMVSGKGIRLTWTAGRAGTSRDVYLGTNTTLTASNLVSDNQCALHYDTGPLMPGTVYRWRVDEKNANGTTTGSVYTFETAPMEP